MTRRVWLGLLLAGLLTGGRAAAQEDEFKVEDRNHLTNLRDGKSSFKDNQAANQDAVNKGARWAVLRITDPVNRGIKQGIPKPMSTLVQDAATLMVDPNGAQRGTLTEGQRDYVQAFGKAVVGHLRTIFGTKEKPSTYELLVRINAARILSFVGRSGYEEAADLAIEIIENPKESDAVKLYVLQALRHLFAVNNPEDKKASAITKPERELKAIQTLIAYIVRKPPLSADASADEYEALRYVRREAVRALGNVRKPIIRKDKTILAEPALWLLKVAGMDEAIPLTPGPSERIEAVIGYFQLNPDRTQNVDFAIYWTGATLVEAAALAKDRIDPKLAPPEPVPGKEVSVQESYGWRVAAARLLGTMKEWKEAWDLEHPTPPQPQAGMVADIVDKTKTFLLEPLVNASEKKEVEADQLKAWWAGQTWPNRTLYKDSPNSIVTPAKRD